MAKSFSKIYQRSTYRQFRVLDSLGVPYGTSLPTSNTETLDGSLFVLVNLADRTKDELYSYDSVSGSWNQIKTTGAGKSAYEIAVDNGYVGTETDWLASLHGASGKSAYQEWVDNGHPGGTVEDFINSLKGQDGIGIPSGGATGEVLRKKSTDPYDVEWSTPAGGGDMLSSVYDPTGVNGDAFDYGNLHSVPVLDTTPTAALSGTANTYTGTFTPTVALTAGLKIRFMTNVDNTGASTLDADGTGAKAIVAPDGSALSGGELKADQYSEAVYNGTAWQLLGGGSGGGGGSIPPGGTTGQVLTKQSATDGDADWDDLPTEIVWKADEASFPLTGEDGKAYVARDTGLMYRWDTTGSEYKQIGGGGSAWGTITGTLTDQTDLTAYIASQTADGDTAFSWGNHASAGYLTSIPANTTLMGNTFNGADQLVKLDGSGKLPAVDGSLLTNLPSAGWLIGGNTEGGIFGTTGFSSVIFKTNNNERAFLSKVGGLTVLSPVNSDLYSAITIGSSGAASQLMFINWGSLDKNNPAYTDGVTQAMTPGYSGYGIVFGTPTSQVMKIDNNGVTVKALTVNSALASPSFKTDVYGTGQFYMSSPYIGINYPASQYWFFVIKSGSNFVAKADQYGCFVFGNDVSGSVLSSAQLEVRSNTKGFLPPRMTTTQWGMISSKAEGLQAWSNDDHGQLWFDGTGTIGFRYNRSTSKFQGFDGTNWIDLN